MVFEFDNSFHKSLEGFYAPAEAAAALSPKLLICNFALVEQLGIAIDGASDYVLTRIFAGQDIPDSAEPLAFAYAGHQFGHFSEQLGDGRALLIGEIIAPNCARFDVQLKGSGPTAFSRKGDGKAALGPVLREYLVSEAMAAMGVPTTRALAAVATGDRVQREQAHPGAVLTRVASSHIRVGTFQFFAAHFGVDHVVKLSNYTIWRHWPELAEAPNPHLALLDRVIGLQCELVARWMGVGFVHGVMNTDNVAISGETLDYGPCAFMDHFAVNTVFSSIDVNGRYAYGRQPQITHWNMARFAEAMLPAIHAVDPADVNAARALVDAIPARFRALWLAEMRTKLGLGKPHKDDEKLIDALFGELEQHSVDFSSFFRALAQLLRGDGAMLQALLPDAEAMAPWIAEWWAQLEREAIAPLERADAMDAVNPLYIPRNHLVEAALIAAEEGDMAPWHALLEVVQNPYVKRPECDAYAQPAPADAAPHVTFCGT